MKSWKDDSNKYPGIFWYVQFDHGTRSTVHVITCQNSTDALPNRSAGLSPNSACDYVIG